VSAGRSPHALPDYSVNRRRKPGVDKKALRSQISRRGCGGTPAGMTGIHVLHQGVSINA
jgi:hypothetical protein